MNNSTDPVDQMETFRLFIDGAITKIKYAIANEQSQNGWNGTFGYQDNEPADKLQRIIRLYITPFVCLFGIIFNSLNLRVLISKEATRNIPSCVFLTALAIGDSVWLAIGCWQTVPLALPLRNERFIRIYAPLIPYVMTVSTTIFVTSIWLVTSFNIERYLAICHPIYARRKCTKQRAIGAIILIYICAFITSCRLPILLSGRRNNNKFELGYRRHVTTVGPIITKWIQGIVLTLFWVAPLLTLPIVNFKIYRTLRALIKRDITMKASRRRSTQAMANRLLIAVMVPFIICIFPQVPQRVLIQFDQTTTLFENAKLYIILCEFLLFVHCASNSILYCFVSKRYRSIFKRHFCRSAIGLRCMSTDANDDDDDNQDCCLNGDCDGDHPRYPTRKYGLGIRQVENGTRTPKAAPIATTAV